MHSRVLRKLVLSLLAASLGVACGESDANPVKAAYAAKPKGRAAGPSVAFRFPAAGGSVRVYRLPRFDEVAWRIDAGGLTAKRVVGFSQDDDLIYLLSPKNTLLALDLGTGRPRTVDTMIALATLGPTGVPHTVKLDGAVGTVEHRSPVPWPAKIPPGARDVWAGGRGRLLVDTPTEQGRELLTVTAGQPAEHRLLPAGPTAVSMWGDLVVVATDSGLVQILPNGATARVLRMGRSASAVAISPSGHRIYAALRGGTLIAIDRYTGDVIDRVPIPGEAAALRLDPLGRLMLLQPATEDSAWVVDLSRDAILGRIPGPWGPDLPAVAPDGSVLVRRRNDVVAFSPDSLKETGRVAGAAGDQWLAVAWDPRRPNLDVGDENQPDAAQPTQSLFVQVASTSNQAWADDLSKDLRSAGMNATVLKTTGSEDSYRVVIGPFPTREAAEDTGRKLGRPFWIFSPETDAPTQ